MKKHLIIASLSILFTLKIIAQIPPERTWYENNYGEKTTVNERWSEDNSGQMHGTYIKYFPDGKREVYGSYSHGKKHGKWEFSNLNLLGGISSKSIYTYSNDVKNGEYQLINYADNSIEKGNYCNDLKTGFWKENHKELNGKIIYQEGNYLNGIKNGEWKNTRARPYTKNEIYNFGYLLKNMDGYFQDSNKKEFELKTIEGYRTFFSNGNIQSSFDQNGVNIFEQYLKEELEQKKADEEYRNKVKLKEANQLQKEIFDNAMDKYYDDFRDKYYGDTSDLHSFLIRYSNGNPDYIKKAKEAIKNKPDNDAFYLADNIYDYLSYEKNFRNGMHIQENENRIKSCVLINRSIK